MSAPELPAGWGVAPVDPANDFKKIQAAYLAKLDPNIIDKAYNFAAYRLSDLYELPPRSLCVAAIFKLVGERSGTEMGGGVQLDFVAVDELIGDYRVSVPVQAYDLEGMVTALEPFEPNEAEQIARAVCGIEAFCDLGGLCVAADLSRLKRDPEPLIIDIAYRV